MEPHALNAPGAPIARMGPKQNSPRLAPPAITNDSPVPSTEANEGARVLPNKQITANNAEESYVQFIFYCNPSIPSISDTAELRRVFHSMPKTDGKTFDTYTLFELIQKLEAKEIETWHQLVIDMGVSPPDVASGQSTQKIQQYAVRLKRWLHASHIDAFFQYCLGKPNSYYNDIPPVESEAGSGTRDGVPPDEDLALRTLVPSFRPKRGRRPNEEGHPTPSVKRPLLAAPWTEETPVSALLKTASPWDRSSTPRDIWAAARQAITPRPENMPSSTPQTSQEPRSCDNGQLGLYMEIEGASTHPQSATTPRAPMSAFPTLEPQSAHPATARPRKRHRQGPTVSAAWSTDTTSAGRTRGRPPANKTIQDGPFSTFPARQNPPRSSTPPSTTTATHQTGSVVGSFAKTSPSQPRKPSKLSLQVPQHAGGPVRLATPPAPKLIVNTSEGSSGQVHERRSSADFFNIDEGLSETGESEEELPGNGEGVDWKRRAIALQRKVRSLEAELKTVKRKVLEAVM